MSQRDVSFRRTDLAQPFEGSPVQLNSRRAAVSGHDFNIAPPDAIRPAGAKRFHDCLFRRKPRRVARKPRRAILAIADLLIGEHAAAKPVASALEHLLDSINFNQVNTYCNDHVLDLHLHQVFGQDRFRKDRARFFQQRGRVRKPRAEMCEQQPARARFESSPGRLRGSRVTVLTSLSREFLRVGCFVNQQINAPCKLNRLSARPSVKTVRNRLPRTRGTQHL